MSKKMCAYISGPVSGVKDNNAELFHAAEIMLQALGYDTVNPVTAHGDAAACMTYTEFMRADLLLLLGCDILLLLPGWQYSKGSTHEVAFANICGIPIYSFSTLEHPMIGSPWGQVSVAPVEKEIHPDMFKQVEDACTIRQVENAEFIRDVAGIVEKPDDKPNQMRWHPFHKTTDNVPIEALGYKDLNDHPWEESCNKTIQQPSIVKEGGKEDLGMTTSEIKVEISEGIGNSRLFRYYKKRCEDLEKELAAKGESSDG